MRIKRSKCEFAKEQIQFSGFTLQEGTAAMLDQTNALITELMVPKDLRELQNSLGFVNFFKVILQSCRSSRHAYLSASNGTD